MRYVHDSQPCNQHCRCRCQARSNKRVASRSFGRRLARRHCSRSFDIRYCIRIRPAVCTFRWRNCSNTVNTCSSRIHPSCIHSRIRNNYSACIGCWCKVGCKRARKHRPSMRIRRSNDVGRGRRCNTASKEKFNRINFRLEITELPPSYNSNDISSRRKFPIYWLCTSPCTERIPSSCNCGKKRFDSYFSIDQFIYIYIWRRTWSFGYKYLGSRLGKLTRLIREERREKVERGGMPFRDACRTVSQCSLAPCHRV